MKSRGLFGTSGIRGDGEKLFTDQFCFDLARTFSIFLDNYKEKGGIAIGLDPRGTSPRIKDAMEAGLVYEKREVFDQGATPVPSMCYIMKTSEKYAGSIMVSGSHIQPHLNGIKFFAFEEEILKHHEKEIENIFSKIRNKIHFKKAVDYEIHDENKANDEYKEMLVKIADAPYPKWRVVVDPGDGAQSDTMPQVLKRLGVDVIELHATIQGKFYARDTEHIPDMMDLINSVKKEKADFGIGYDADGDRVVFVDEKGNFIPGDYSACIIAKESLGSRTVTPISTSQVVDHIGRKVYRTKVGAPYVIEKMKDYNIRYGFEPNGGAIFSEIMLTRDGGSTSIKLLDILKRKNKKLSELMEELPKFYSFKDKVDYKWELQSTILSEAKKVFKGIKTDETDGLKIWLDKETWMLFRSSQNAPEFRIFVESASEVKAKELSEKGVSLVKNIVKRSE